MSYSSGDRLVRRPTGGALLALPIVGDKEICLKINYSRTQTL